MKTVIIITLFAAYLKTIKTTEYCSGIPLAGITIKPSCSRSGANIINCADPIKEGTIAKITCGFAYSKKKGDAKDTIFCNSGRWSGRPFHCEQICGIYDSRFPERTGWQAVVYVNSNGETHSCGGTILSVRLIITTARCIWNKIQEKVVDASNVEVQVGMYYLDRYSSQSLEVSEIHIPEGFQDSKSSYQDDIAILVLKDHLLYTLRTYYTTTKVPPCIEWLDNNKKAANNTVKGRISTAVNTEYNVELSYSECDYNTNLDGDKVFEISCKAAFDKPRNCSIDNGSAFVVGKSVDGEERSFLRGIVANVRNTGTECSNIYFVTITNIQHHSAMILDYMKKYAVEYDLKRSESFPCEVSFIPNLKVFLEENDGTKTSLAPGNYVNGLNKVIYSCKKNYELIGTTTNYCYYDRFYKAGKWAENHPVCVPMTSLPTPAPPPSTCVIPKIPQLTVLDLNSQEIAVNYAESQDRIQYKCKRNYHLIGKSENACNRGTWIWDHPSCASIPVGSPTEERCEVPFLPDGIIVLEGAVKKNISVGNYVENENSISYSCTEGRLLHGGSSNYCHEGKWVSEHPSCIKFVIGNPTKDDCELPRIQNGITVVDSVVKKSESSPNFVKNYDQIWYKCKKNYQLEGESSNICYYNGVWRSEHPQCIKITADSCEVPAIPNLSVVLEGEEKKTLSFGTYVENFNIISYSCRQNHRLQGRSTNNCINGKWTDEHPTCIKYCPSDSLKGVTFIAICEFNGVRIPCDSILRTGTIARIFCQYGYKKPDQLAPEEIICDDTGNWDSNPYRCEPICGTEHSETVPYIKGGEKANITAVPWHAAIYSFIKGKYSQICGGTIISSNVVVSAAHCFWQGPELVTDHSKIAVGVGKYFRDYFADEPLTPQIFNVSEIYIPEGFQGPLQAYHDDIAILVLKGYIEFKPYIKPICIRKLDEEGKTIQSGLLGRVAGWGKTKSDLPSEELQMLEISTLSYTDCINAVDVRFRNQIASDKFCISSPEAESVCPGDSGGGFVIPKVINEEKTYFLWGIVSNGLTDRDDCENVNLTSLTNIQHYYDKILYYQKTFGIK